MSCKPGGATTTRYGPRLAPNEGLWCWGCARRFTVGGERPERWIEGLCGLDDCALPHGVSA